MRRWTTRPERRPRGGGSGSLVVDRRERCRTASSLLPTLGLEDPYEGGKQLCLRYYKQQVFTYDIIDYPFLVLGAIVASLLARPA
jgi:hypothetical protein